MDDVGSHTADQGPQGAKGPSVRDGGGGAAHIDDLDTRPCRANAIGRGVAREAEVLAWRDNHVLALADPAHQVEEVTLGPTGECLEDVEDGRH